MRENILKSPHMLHNVNLKVVLSRLLKNRGMRIS